MTTFIKFDITQYTYETSEPDPDDSWSRASTDGDVYINNAYIVPEDGYDTLAIDANLQPGDVVYLVWAKYGTGDSFGSDGGQYELLKVFTDKAAARKCAIGYEDGTEDGYYPWTGYFEWLQAINVETLVL